MNRKLLVVGLDGVSWSILNQLINRELLPTFKMLIENGVHGVLVSTNPPSTGPAWVSFATGKNPGKHGVFDFVMPRNSLKRLKPVTSLDIKCLTFYEILERNGRKCILINMPVTYPPRINGIVITSLMTLGNNCVFPKSLLNEVPELKNYRIIPNTSLSMRGKLVEYFQDIRRLENVRFKCAQKLFRRDWDFFFILFNGTDWIHHIAYGRLLHSENSHVVKEAIALYQDIDSYIKWFISSAPEDMDVLIVSDHGFRTCSESFFINEWLRSRKYLNVYVKPKTSISSHKLTRTRELSRKHIQPPSAIIKLLVLLAKRLPVSMLYPLYLTLQKHTPFTFRFTLSPDFNRTLAYCVSIESRSIYINAKRKFRNGVVEDKLYEIVRGKIINELKQLNESSGKYLFKDVLKSEDVYSGPFFKYAPDIVVVPNSCRVDGRLIPIVRHRWSGSDHDFNGIFIAYGPSIRSKAKINNVKIYDIAPTILYFFNVSAPKDVDGRVLMEIFK